MYELVKKKNTGQKILIGIVVLFLVTSALKELLRTPRLSIDDELVKVANEINSHAPVILDSVTRFDYVNAFSGKVFQYNYTILKIDPLLVDTVELARSGREYMIRMLKNNPKLSYFRENKIELQARYVDKDGKYVSSFSVYPQEYQ